MAGFNIKKLETSGSQDIELDFGEEIGKLELTVIPSKMTLGMTTELAECDRTQDYGRAAKIFFSVVTKWNAEIDGEPIPLTEEAIPMLGLEFFLVVLDRLGKLAVQKGRTAPSSPDGSKSLT
ncbi:MAG: hypothetical protein WBA46_17150 [Thermomicrobiales bacterium]